MRAPAHLPDVFGRAAAAPPALGFPLVDLFLDSRFCVYQAFSGITHKCMLTSWMPPSGRFADVKSLTITQRLKRATPPRQLPVGHPL